MIDVHTGCYRLRALSNSIAPPANSKNPTANNTVLTVPSSVAATMLMMSPTTSIAMPHVASRFLPFGYLLTGLPTPKDEVEERYHPQGQKDHPERL